MIQARTGRQGNKMRQAYCRPNAPERFQALGVSYGQGCGALAAGQPRQVALDIGHETPAYRCATPSMSCQPTARVCLEWIVAHRIGKALESTPAQRNIAAAFASVATPSSVTQGTQELTLAIDLLKRSFKKISNADGHAPARVHVAIGHYGDECITRGAMIRRAACQQELEGAMHCDLGAAEPAHRGVVPCLMNDFKEFACFSRGQDLLR